MIEPQEICRNAFELLADKQFDDAEKLLTFQMGKTEDPVAMALFHSALGVSAKMQAKYKDAWRHYDRAEKLLPNDPALKIISARLLIDQFSETKSAIKKAKQVLELIPNNRAFAHQAYTTMGLAYVKEGKKQQTLDMLRNSIVEDFEGFVTTDNIDFHLVEAVARKRWDLELVREFISKALACAESHRETEWAVKLQRMLDAIG